MKNILNFLIKTRLTFLGPRDFLKIVIPYVKNLDFPKVSSLLNELNIKHQTKTLGQQDLATIPRFSILQFKIAPEYSYVFIKNVSKHEITYIDDRNHLKKLSITDFCNMWTGVTFFFNTKSLFKNHINQSHIFLLTLMITVIVFFVISQLITNGFSNKLANLLYIKSIGIILIFFSIITLKTSSLTKPNKTTKKIKSKLFSLDNSLNIFLGYFLISSILLVGIDSNFVFLIQKVCNWLVLIFSLFLMYLHLFIFKNSINKIILINAILLVDFFYASNISPTINSSNNSITILGYFLCIAILTYPLMKFYTWVFDRNTVIKNLQNKIKQYLFYKKKIKNGQKIKMPYDLKPINLNDSNATNTILIVSDPDDIESSKMYSKIEQLLTSMISNQLQFQIILVCKENNDDLKYCIKTIIASHALKSKKVNQMISDLHSFKNYQLWISKYPLKEHPKFNTISTKTLASYLLFFKNNNLSTPLIFKKKR